MKNYKELFRALAQDKNIYSSHIVALCAYKALNAKSNVDKLVIFKALLDKAFSPITNKNKLKNGKTPYWTLEVLLYGNRIFSGPNGNAEPSLSSIVNDIVENDEEAKQFKDLFKSALYSIQGSTDPFNTVYYSYVIVEPTISISQQLVQSVHAGIELGHLLAREKISVDNLHLVAVHRPDNMTIAEYNTFINNKLNIDSVTFVEPDLENMVTAIATFPIAKKAKGNFKGLQLIRYGV